MGRKYADDKRIYDGLVRTRNITQTIPKGYKRCRVCKIIRPRGRPPANYEQVLEDINYVCPACKDTRKGKRYEHYRNSARGIIKW